MKELFTTKFNKNEIVLLRKLAFSNKFQDKVCLEGLNWNNTDENSIHVCFYAQEELLSTLRITQYSSKKKFDIATQIPLIEDKEQPYVLLARAATHPKIQHTETHAKLRVLALEICLQFNLKHVFGSLQKKSQRLDHLLNLGYTLVQSQDRWPESYLQNDGEVVLICLEGLEKISGFVQSERKRLNFSEILNVENLEFKKY